MKLKTILYIIGAFAIAWLARVIFTGNVRYLFVVGNAVLAAVPIFLEPVFISTARKVKGLWRKSALVFLSAVWLLFLPNAFYVITDFMHLNGDVLVNAPNDGYGSFANYTRGDGVFIFDSLLFFVLTAFGAYVGGLALVRAFLFLKKKTTQAISVAALSLIMLLVSVGVYIGRFGRWNSWEGLFMPHMILSELIRHALSMQTRSRFFIVVATALLLQIASFFYIYNQHRFNASREKSPRKKRTSHHT